MRIVYHSFGGRFSDSPRALFTALKERGDSADEHTWLADPAHAAAFPPGVATREWGTRDARVALEAADLLVANTYTEMAWDKRPEATYLQTWHGTPLKRIHWDSLWQPGRRLENLDLDVVKWDILLSPNHFSTPLLTGAFRFEGEVLESGYPRNDVLSAANRAEVRARVRRELGIADGQRAILYAPTWRDDAVLPEGGKTFSLGLDPLRVGAALATSNSVLLLRLHYLLTGRMGALDHPAIREVSFYPDISELYLAADVLVTDYSSTMFDFAVTGKPQLFFVYDLEDYKGRLRGFYFDFAPEAPGPLLRTEEELLAALETLDDVTAEYAERYEVFRERFCLLEDGAASERVLARVLAPGG